MAVPKRKTSKARRDKRRNNVWKISAPTLVSSTPYFSCTSFTDFALPAVSMTDAR